MACLFLFIFFSLLHESSFQSKSSFCFHNKGVIIIITINYYYYLHIIIYINNIMIITISISKKKQKKNNYSSKKPKACTHIIFNNNIVIPFVLIRLFFPVFFNIYHRSHSLPLVFLLYLLLMIII